MMTLSEKLVVFLCELIYLFVALANVQMQLNSSFKAYSTCVYNIGVQYKNSSVVFKKTETCYNKCASVINVFTARCT